MSYTLSALDSFGMVMSTFGTKASCLEHLAQAAEPTTRSYTHGRAVAEAVIWLWVYAM